MLTALYRPPEASLVPEPCDAVDDSLVSEQRVFDELLGELHVADVFEQRLNARPQTAVILVQRQLADVRPEQQVLGYTRVEVLSVRKQICKKNTT